MHNNNQRLAAIDALRGWVIVLMAIDHVRDFWSLEAFQPEDLTQTSPEYFFTRWITHLCAPVFVFLSGTSAHLYWQKTQDKKQVAWFLFSRGLWLIFIEMTLINFSWSLTLPGLGWGLFLQVLWAIGVAMIALSALLWLSTPLLLFLGLLLTFGHNALDFLSPSDFGSLGWLWKIGHDGGWLALNAQGSFGLYVVYPVIPWIGVIVLGYVFGHVVRQSHEMMQRHLLALGTLTVLAFVVLRWINGYGDPTPWSEQATAMFTFMSFLNTQKYPPSLLFLLMTLGPAFWLLWLFNRVPAARLKWLTTFGREPFFFYALHFLLIHLSSMLYFRLLHGQWFDLANTRQAAQWPDFYQPSLGRLYLAWLFTVVVFYFACRWYHEFKLRSNKPWLRYL